MKGLEVVVGVSGASGAQLARRFVELAVTAPELSRFHLILSDPALRVARNEIDPSIREASDWLERLSMPRRAKTKIVLHDNRDVAASIASGSYPTSGMAVIPCSGGTLGAIANGISHVVGSVEAGKLADLVLWKPAFFGVKPSLILKGGMIASAAMGDPNASIPTPQPVHYRPMFGAFGKALRTSVTFVSKASLRNPALKKLGLAKPLVAVENTRRIGKRDMKLNDALPAIDVDPETYEVRADGKLLTCEPAAVLPMAQRYFLF